MRNLRRNIALLGGILLGIAFTSSAQEARFEPAECAFAVPDGAVVECGYLLVPEDRSGDPSDTIQLYTAIYRAQAASPQADPIIFLQGGPGGAIVATLAMSYERFIAPLTQDRDFIVFDQRGTGLSTPALNCPEYTAISEEIYSGALSGEASIQPTIDAIAACSERLQNEAGVNPAAYTSASNAADVADMVAVLGYEQVNLYGGSYGTRLAQTIMRDYPALVRSAVLDGVIPVELNLFEEQAAKSQNALDRLFAACEADAECAATYPNLATVFAETVAQLNETPLVVPIVVPTTGNPLDVQLNGDIFLSALFFSFQSGALVGTIPQTIYQVREGNTEGLSTALLIPFLIGDTVNIGMFFAVNCHEEAYASSPEALEASADAYPLVAGLARLALGGSGQAMFDVCAAWGAAPFDPREAEAVTSDIPALVMSGEFDSATPPIWGDQVVANLSNSTHLVLPAKGHVESAAGGCPLEIAQAFINDPNAELEVSCLDAMPRISFAGTASALAAASAANADVTLEAFDDAEAGVQGLLPAGWVRASAGTYVRGQSMTDQTVLILLAAPLPSDDLLAALAGQFGIADFGTASEREANGLAWSLYTTEAELMGIPLAVNLAAASNGEGSIVAVFISDKDERDALYDAVFLPVVDALLPIE